MPNSMADRLNAQYPFEWEPFHAAYAVLLPGLEYIEVNYWRNALVLGYIYG